MCVVLSYLILQYLGMPVIRHPEVEIASVTSCLLRPVDWPVEPLSVIWEKVQMC